MVIVQYEYVTEPSNIAEILGTGEKFTEWLSEHTLEELGLIRDVFEEYELYEHCAVIRDTIKKYKKTGV